MSARTTRHYTRWDAPHAGVCHAHPALFSFPKQSIITVHNYPGGVRPVSPAGDMAAAEYDHESTTPVSRQAGRRHGLHGLMRIL